jgi:hypothetical protein
MLDMKSSSALRGPELPGGSFIEASINGDYAHVSGTANVCVSIPVCMDEHGRLLDTYKAKEVGYISVEIMSDTYNKLRITIGHSKDGDNTKPICDQPGLIIYRSRDPKEFDIYTINPETGKEGQILAPCQPAYQAAAEAEASDI